MAAHGHAPLRLHDISPHVGYVRVRLVDGAVQWELRQFVARLISRSTAKFLKDPCRPKGCSRSEFVSISVAGSLAPGFLACVVPSRRQLWIAWLWIAWSYIPLVCRRRARAGRLRVVVHPVSDGGRLHSGPCPLFPNRFLWQAAQAGPPHHGLGVDQAQRLPGGHVRFPCCRTSITRPSVAFHSPDHVWPSISHARPQRPCFGLGLFRPLGEPACLLVFIDVLRARVYVQVCVS